MRFAIKRILALLMTLSVLASSFAVTGLSVSAEGIASVNGVSYPSLQAAYANASEGDSIYLLGDVSVGETLNINKAVNLYAKGTCRITRASGFDGAIFNITAKTFGIYGGEGELIIDGGNTEVTSPLVKVSGGTFIMNSGSAVVNNNNSSVNGSAVMLSSGTFDFRAGSISYNSSAGYGDAVYMAAAATFKLSGSAVISAPSSVFLEGSAFVTLTSAPSSDISLYVSNISDGAKIAEAAQGVILTSEQAGHLKLVGTDKSYKAVILGQSILAQKDSSEPEYLGVAEYNGQKYDTLTEALADVHEEYASIYILKDFAVNYETEINGERKITLIPKTNAVISRAADYKGELFSVEAGAALTLSGSLQINGSGVEAQSSAFSVMGELVLKSGVILSNHDNSSSLISIEGGKLIMNGGTVSGNKASEGIISINSGSFDLNSGSVNSNTTVNGGAVYVKDGSFAMAGGDIYANSATLGGGVYIADKGSFFMSSGKIYSNLASAGSCVWSSGSFTLSGNAHLSSQDALKPMVYLDNGSVIDVAAGWTPVQVTGYSNIISVALKTPKLNTVVVKFASEVKEELFAASKSLGEGYALKVLDKTLVISTEEKGFAAYYNEIGYATLEEAFSALPLAGSATVYLVNDTVVSATIPVKQGQVITLATAVDPVTNAEYTQRTVKRAEGFDAAVFSVEKGGSLKLGAMGKSLIIDGETREVNSAAVYTKGNFELSVGASIINNNNKATQQIGEKVFSYGGGVFADDGGVFTLSGGSITGCYASYGGGVYVKNAALTLSNGSISSNSALYGGGVYLMTAEAAAEGAHQPLAEETEEIRAFLTMGDGSIEKNTAVSEASLHYSGMGGGVYVGNGSCFDMTGGKLIGNSAPKGGAVSVGDIPADAGAEIKNPEFVLSQKAVIDSKNTVYLAVSEISYISVIPELTAQKAPIVISLPVLMPQNMTLVKYIEAKKEETAAQLTDTESKLDCSSALESKLFELDEEASKYFVLSLAPNNTGAIINTTEEGSFAGLLTGEHYNGIQRYEEIKEEAAEAESEETAETKAADDENDDAKEHETEPELVQLNYEGITLNPEGTFTAHYFMTYYPGLYSKVDAVISAPFVKGTYITMVDYSHENSAAYYYYRVSGEEEIKREGLPTERKDENGAVLNTPGIIEIPLSSFVKLGTQNQYYELVFDADAEKVTEHMLFTVKFADAEAPEGVTLCGNFAMEWNHYIDGEIKDVRYDISEGLKASYTVNDLQSSEVYIEVEEDEVTLSYNLNDNSNAVAQNCGVILINLNGKFPKGTVFTDEEGKRYLAFARASGVAVTIPKDSMGNLIKSGEIVLSAENYYGNAVSTTNMTAFVYASDDGMHYDGRFEADASAEAVKFSLPAKEKYAVLVTTPDGSEKPFYDGYTQLSDTEFLEMKVKGMYNTKEIESFTLFLQRKTEEGYVNCALSELFKIDDPGVKQVILDTGDVNLELITSIKSVLGEEFKIGFRVGDAVEFIKVNVTDDR